MTIPTYSARRKIGEGRQMHKKILNKKHSIYPGQFLIMRYGCGEHMLGEYRKLETPLLVKVNALYDHCFTVEVIGNAGARVPYAYSYSDLVIGELIREFS